MFQLPEDEPGTAGWGGPAQDAVSGAFD
jgi:hypothetical protein